MEYRAHRSKSTFSTAGNMIVGKQFLPSSNGMKTKVTENTYTYAQAQSNRATYAGSLAGQKQGQKP